MKKYLHIILFICIYANLSATDYYFSSSAGDDGNTGTSEGQAWATMSKFESEANSGTFQPGDFIYFKRGDRWDSTYVVINSNFAGSYGNKITMDAYGTGNDPLITGNVILTGFSETADVWAKTGSGWPAEDPAPNVWIDGNLAQIALENGFLNTSQYSDLGTSYVEDLTKSWTTNEWTDTWVAKQSSAFTYSVAKITSNTSNTLSYADDGLSESQYDMQYLLFNGEALLDVNNEYYYGPDVIKIFHTGDLNSITVEMTRVDTMITFQENHYTEWRNIEFRGALQSVLTNKGTSNISFYNCTMTGGLATNYYNGNEAGYCDTVSFVSCTISHGGRYSMFFDAVGFVNIDSCHFFKGNWNVLQQGSFTLSYPNEFSSNLQVILADSFVVQNCFFDSCGLPIQTHARDATMDIRYNLFRDNGSILDDIGCIYMGGDNDPSPSRIYKNIFFRGIQTGVVAGAHIQFHGLYCDYSTDNVIADSNCFYSFETAMYGHVSNTNTWSNNIVLDGGANSSVDWDDFIRLDEWTFNHGAEGTAITGYNIQDNYLIMAPGTTMEFFQINDIMSEGSNTVNNNNYFAPYSTSDDWFAKRIDFSETFSGNMADWTTETGWDASSVYDNTQYDTVLFVMNATGADIDFLFTGSGVDLYGNSLTGTISVPSWYGVAMFFTSFTSVDSPEIYEQDSKGGILYRGAQEEGGQPSPSGNVNFSNDGGTVNFSNGGGAIIFNNY